MLIAIQENVVRVSIVILMENWDSSVDFAWPF